MFYLLNSPLTNIYTDLFSTILFLLVLAKFLTLLIIINTSSNIPTYPLITYMMLTSLSKGTLSPINVPIAARIRVMSLNLLLFSSAILEETVQRRGTAVVNMPVITVRENL